MLQKRRTAAALDCNTLDMDRGGGGALVGTQMLSKTLGFG